MQCSAAEPFTSGDKLYRMPDDDRLTRVTSICLALPEATPEVHGQHAGFLVRKRHFAYYLDDHHGDGIVGINCKVLPHDNERLIAADAERFYMPAYIGARGWVGLRLDRGEVDWEEVSELLTHSYLMTAPKRLAKLVEQSVT
jgi:predicted DNA-binding protein (MmcQ/YjbR family)